MTPKEKAIFILNRINGAKITVTEWVSASDYAKSDLKRKANVVVDEIIEALKITTGHCDLRRIDANEVVKDFQFWKEVKQEIERI